MIYSTGAHSTSFWLAFLANVQQGRVLELEMYAHFVDLHINTLHIHRVQLRECLLTPLQATDPGGIVTMVTESGRSFTRQIKTEDTAVQETNPATPGRLVFGNSIYQ